MHWPAVEALIALGADVNITICQQRVEKWEMNDVPCNLTQRRTRGFWKAKMENIVLLRLTPEAVQDSIFGLIHLAVSHQTAH